MTGRGQAHVTGKSSTCVLARACATIAVQWSTSMSGAGAETLLNRRPPRCAWPPPICSHIKTKCSAEHLDRQEAVGHTYAHKSILPSFIQVCLHDPGCQSVLHRELPIMVKGIHAQELTERRVLPCAPAPKPLALLPAGLPAPTGQVPTAACDEC